MTSNLPGSQQAHDMISRVSPEGRARAKADYDRKQRAARRMAWRVLLAALIIAVLTTGTNALFGPIGAMGFEIALAVFLAAFAAIAIVSRKRPVTRESLVAANLHALPERTQEWLDLQRKALPAPAVVLLDDIGVRLDALQPQLDRLDAREPAADAVTKLIAVELPNLVERYRQLPTSLRDKVRDDGQTPDAHLQRGLAMIDGEIERMTEQLARGAFDELATQNRYLELKYEGDEGV